ncbi:MAG TPA: hypothetical protein VE007_09605 [Thermoanaerobaculia bacterium]|nr:hypothetical protein [Thermoanaerobaculia bacterium]
MKRLGGILGAALALAAFFVASQCSKSDSPTSPPANSTATPTPTPGTIAPTTTPTPGVSSPTPTVTPGAATRTATPAPTGTPGPAAFAGNWTGAWVNNTFSTTGPASLSVAVNTAAQTFQFTLALGGNVFGAGTPPPQTLSGTYTAAGATITGHSTLFGDVTMSIGSNGAVSGQAINVPNPQISRIDFAGTANAQTITLTYVIQFTTGGIATGVLTLNHQ